jgi:hypothetical protein
MRVCQGVRIIQISQAFVNMPSKSAFLVLLSSGDYAGMKLCTLLNMGEDKLIPQSCYLAHNKFGGRFETAVSMTLCRHATSKTIYTNIMIAPGLEQCQGLGTTLPVLLGSTNFTHLAVLCVLPLLMNNM